MTDITAQGLKEFLEQLRDNFQEILPQLEIFRIGADPQDFERNFALFERRLGQQ